MLKTHRVYRNIGLKDLFFGFEVIDAFLIFLVFNLANIFNVAFLINLTVTVSTAALIRIAKLNKPRGYFSDVIRFFARRRCWSNTRS